MYVEFKVYKNTRAATASLEAVRARAPSHIRKVLADNNEGFTERVHNES